MPGGCTVRSHRTSPSRASRPAGRSPPSRGRWSAGRDSTCTSAPGGRFHAAAATCLVVVLLLLTLIAAALPGIAAGARTTAPDRLGEFLWGLAGQESGWDWTTRNVSSGAYGRYQIMPVNWPAWADDYLGDRWADQTPRNQELVARGKIAALHDWLGSWRRVAYWWLTGDTETNEQRWSDLAAGYVRNVMALMKRAPAGGDPIPPDPAGDGPPADRGDWRLVVDGAVLYTAIHDGARIGRVRDGAVLFVQASRWNRRDTLWLKVSTADGRIGWASIRRTVPWDRPAKASRWRRDGKVTHPGHGPGPKDDDGRDRARPRPR